MLLAIDTSAGSSAAVFVDGELLSFVSIDDPFGHAENIGNVIVQALSEAKVSHWKITAIAIGRGPAPYTGLRVGMATGLAMAESLQVPAFGVVALDAVSMLYANQREFVVVSDAKRRQFFARSYRSIDKSSIPTPNSDPEVIEPAEISDRFPGLEVFQTPCSAKEVGRYAFAAMSEGIDLSDTSALYLRSPDVSPSAGKRVTG
ncbi:MAG: tRNA ((37)-N6)-threonylcarbamoyltransferase complex dimerization subunit type 1 TsaB [Actinomycetota bacterium]